MSFLGEHGVVLAKKWIAGTRMEDGIRVAKELNGNGEEVLLNDLGEGIADRARVEQITSAYVRLIETMKRDGIRGGVSVKATQLGMLVSAGSLSRNYERIVKRAAERRVFVWLDMEEYEYIDGTIALYTKFVRRYPSTGICLQAKLKRSYGDMKRVVSKGGIIRLVKGAYKYDNDISYPDPDAVTENYIRMMRYLFSHKVRFMVATHDSRIIDLALAYERRYKRKIMFGMLRGIRSRLAMTLVEKKESVSIYVPFGQDWFRYSMRRLTEEGHAVLVLRSLLQG